jgi:hypothetical protein
MMSLSSWLLVDSWTEAPCGGPSSNCLVHFIANCRVSSYSRIYSCVIRRYYCIYKRRVEVLNVYFVCMKVSHVVVVLFT